MTVKVWSPTVEVSRFAPFATVPTQVSMPDSRSTHLYFAAVTLSSRICAPSAGAVIVTCGFTASALNAIRFVVGSTRPATSVAWNWTKWFPVVNPESGPV